MTTKHTPGPWMPHGGKPRDGYCFIGDATPTGWPVALVSDRVATGEAEANARLIAAAPELLAALQAMVDNYVDTYGDEGDDAPGSIKTARAAIAKARG